MTLPLFTLIHILISLIGIASGFGMLSGLLAGKLFKRWTAWYLVTTVATSVTGFFFPIKGITPGIVVGILSLVVLAIAAYALYIQHLKGNWCKTFVITSVVALYLNVFVLIAQTFQKNPALVEIAPTQSEPPFAITQGVVLLSFLVLGILATLRFREDAVSKTN